jgi:hypothetical protein
MPKQQPFPDRSIIPKQILGGERLSGLSAESVNALRNHTIPEVIRSLVRTVEPVDTVTTVNVSLSGTLSSGNGNGHTMVDGHRLLVAGQSTASQNGLYIYSSTSAWTRTTDAITSGTTVAVTRTASGLFSGTAWRCYTVNTITVGTTAQTWKQVDSTLWYAVGAAIGLGTTTLTASRLTIDGDTDTGATLALTNSSSQTVLDVSGAASSGTAIAVTAGAGRAIEVSGGSSYHLYSHRNSGAGTTDPLAYFYNQNVADPTPTVLVENTGTNYALDVLRSGTGTVAAMRVRNTAAASHQIALSVSNATDAGGYAIRAALTNATSSDPAIFGISDGVGEGGWFLNTLTGHGLRASKSGATGSALYVATSTSGNTSDAIYGTTVGTGRVANLERNNSAAATAVLKANQLHASSWGPAIEATNAGTAEAILATGSSNTTAAIVANSTGTGGSLAANNYIAVPIIAANGSPATIANGAVLGGGGSTAIASDATDLAGSFILNVGTAPGTNGIMATVTFAVTQPNIPRAIIMTPRNATALAEVGRIYVDTSNATTTTFDVVVGTVPHTASVSSEWQYIVIV